MPLGIKNKYLFKLDPVNYPGRYANRSNVSNICKYFRIKQFQ